MLFKDPASRLVETDRRILVRNVLNRKGPLPDSGINLGTVFRPSVRLVEKPTKKKRSKTST